MAKFEEANLDEEKSGKKKPASFDRIAGNIPDDEKERIFDHLRGVFEKQDFGKLGEFEVEKEAWQIEVIDLANTVVNGLREKYGLEKFEVPSKNVHIVERDRWLKEEVSDDSEEIGLARFSYGPQEIVLMEGRSRLSFAHSVIHEILHFNFHHAIRGERDSGGRLVYKEYRRGLVLNPARPRGQDPYLFVELDEVVTELIARKLLKLVWDDDLFAEEMSETRKTLEGVNRKREEDGKRKIVLGERYYRFYLEEDSDIEDLGSVNVERFSYQDERMVFRKLINKLQEKNKKEFESAEEVYDVFENAYITGNMTELGRLIERTFDRGIFRKLGEAKTAEELEEVVNSL